MTPEAGAAMTPEAGAAMTSEAGAAMTPASPLRFAANLKWLFADLPLVDRIGAAARDGFTAVEIPAPYGTPAAEWRRRAADAGVEVVLINTPLGEPGTPTAGGLACLPDHVRDFRDGVHRALDYAHQIGSPLVHVVGGRRPPELDRERALARFVANVTWAAEQAGQAGRRIVLEMQNQRSAPRFVLESQAMAAAVVEAAGPSCGLLLDLFHHQVQHGDLGSALETYLPATFHLQIGDAPGRTEPGTGEIRWPFVAERLRAGGYQGWLGCEFAPAAPTGVLDRVRAVMSHEPSAFSGRAD